uniref:Phospholipase A2 inhibitor and Ly6/PLAUR domain-containing protein-like n=1 Tax=Pogona vitticeps TaxID=103695 RepID=A0A6J0V6G9_9SAUR
MQTLLGLSLCFVLVTTGATLECEVCAGVGTTCTGSMQTCEAGEDTCVIAVSESSVMGIQTKSVIKMCESSSICQHGPQYMHFGHGQDMRTSLVCCVGDACRTATPQLPPIISKPNGKQCPACFNVFSGNCNPNKTVDCVGPETECLDLEATVTYGKIVAAVMQKGCVTKGACNDTKVNEVKLAGIHTNIKKLECKPASDIA